MRENYLTEAFKDMDSLNEDVFSLDNLGADALKDFLDGDKTSDFIGVIDIEAETEEDLKDSYLGKVILDCCTCHSKCYKNKADIVLDDDEEYANVGEECAYCHSTDGFKIVGEVSEYEEDDEEEDDKEEDEEKIEIKDDKEEKFDDDASSFDFEEKEEEKVEESLNEKVSKTDDIDAEADDKKEIAKKELDKKIDDADADRDYRLKRGITRKNESKIYKKIKESRKPCKEDLSYGEYATIEDEWKKFKEKTGRSDADAAWEFIETECKGTYDTDEEKQDVFSYISTLEEPIEEGCKKEDVNEAPEYELSPKNDSRKSFYGKARVSTGDKGDQNKLYSYNTLVAEMIDGKPVVYGTYSATTLRHIKDWLKQNGFKAENKAQIEADYGKKEEGCRKKNCKRISENWRGEEKIDMIWHGEWADPELEYKDHKFNYWDIEDALWERFLEETDHKDSESDDPSIEEEFNKYIQENAVDYLEDMIAFMDESKCTDENKCNESVEEVKVTTEDEEVNVKTEDGKVTVETQKREDEEKKDEEVIEPVSDEVKSEIEAGSEKDVDGEFGDEVEVDMDEFDEESFDELGESYFKNAYSNIDSYKTSCVKAEGKRMVIEGVIKFKSGKEKATSFVLESKEITKSGKSRFIGENMQICKGKKAFALNGTINGGRFISESLNYDYRTKDIKTGKSKRISGTVKKK